MKLNRHERGLIRFAMYTTLDSERAYLDAIKDCDDDEGRKMKRRTKAGIKRINAFIQKHFPRK